MGGSGEGSCFFFFPDNLFLWESPIKQIFLMICVFLQHDRKLKGGLQGGRQEHLFVFVAVFVDNFFAEVIKPIFFLRLYTLHFLQCCSLSVYERQLIQSGPDASNKIEG